MGYRDRKMRQKLTQVVQWQKERDPTSKARWKERRLLKVVL